MARGDSVQRPIKSGEYILKFADRTAEKNWLSLLATQRNTLAEAWDEITRFPDVHSPRKSPLKGELGTIVKAGVSYKRWQYELRNRARLWYFIF